MNVQRSAKHWNITKLSVLLLLTGLITTCIYVFAGQFIAGEDKRSAIRPVNVSICAPLKKTVIKKL
jgi:hypothetical protein